MDQDLIRRNSGPETGNRRLPHTENLHSGPATKSNRAKQKKQTTTTTTKSTNNRKSEKRNRDAIGFGRFVLVIRRSVLGIDATTKPRYVCTDNDIHDATERRLSVGGLFVVAINRKRVNYVKS